MPALPGHVLQKVSANPGTRGHLVVPETTQKAPCSPAKGARAVAPAPTALSRAQVAGSLICSGWGRDVTAVGCVQPQSALHTMLPRRCGWMAGAPRPGGWRRPGGARAPGVLALLFRSLGRVFFCSRGRAFASGCWGAWALVLPQAAGIGCCPYPPGLPAMLSPIGKPGGSSTVVPTGGNMGLVTRARQNRSAPTPG